MGSVVKIIWLSVCLGVSKSLIWVETSETFSWRVFSAVFPCDTANISLLPSTCVSFYINVREYRRAIKNGQSIEFGIIGHTRRRQTKQKHNTIFVGHHYAQTNTEVILQTTGGKDNRTSFVCGDRSRHHNAELIKTHNRATQKDEQDGTH